MHVLSNYLYISLNHIDTIEMIWTSSDRSRNKDYI